jgi:hypothetical protein
MFMIKKESAWKFETSGTGGVGIEFVAIEGGVIYLRNPSKNVETFHFGAVGAGLAWGLKLPKIGKIGLNVKGKNVGAVVAPTFFPNTGKLYILDTFNGDELSRKDITGACAFVEVYGGLIVGGSAAAIVFGMNPLYLAGQLTTPFVGPAGPVVSDYYLFKSATGLLLTAGLNVGIVGGAGIGGFLGGIL